MGSRCQPALLPDFAPADPEVLLFLSVPDLLPLLPADDVALVLPLVVLPPVDVEVFGAVFFFVVVPDLVDGLVDDLVDLLDFVDGLTVVLGVTAGPVPAAERSAVQ